MNKTFTAKVYSIAGTFKKTLSGNEVIERFEFSSQINGGQGEGTLILNKEFGDTEISTGDIVRIYAYTDDTPGGLIIYSGYISRLSRKYTPQKTVIEYKMIGLSSILNFIYFNSAGYSFNKNQDPAQTIKDVIDYFNTQYSGAFFSYSGGNIQNYGSNVSIDFAYKNCRDSIVSAASATSYWWRIGADGEVWFKPTPGTATHRFTAGKDVSEIEIQESSEEIRNRYILNWKSGTLAPVNDATSQSAYGIRELYQSKTELADSGSATIYATNFLASNKDVKKITSISINNSYNIENIFPGDTLKVLNLDYIVDNLQIKKVSYTPEKVKLDVEVLETLGSTIFNP